MQQRGISPAVLARNNVCMQPQQYIPALKSQQECIAFPYFSGGQLVNIKYRTLDKHFSQVKGAQQIFYGLDDLQVWLQGKQLSGINMLRQQCRPREEQQSWAMGLAP